MMRCLREGETRANSVVPDDYARQPDLPAGPLQILRATADQVRRVREIRAAA